MWNMYLDRKLEKQIHLSCLVNWKNYAKKHNSVSMNKENKYQQRQRVGRYIENKICIDLLIK